MIFLADNFERVLLAMGPISKALLIKASMYIGEREVYRP